MWRGGESSLEVEVYWFNVQLLRHHDPSHDGVDEEREEHVAQEDQHPHQHTDEELLHGVQC